jgi:hypothetical protein
MGKPSNLKVGQRWIMEDHHRGDYFDILSYDLARGFSIRWEDGSLNHVKDDESFIYDYRLDETSTVKSILEKYES